MEHEFLTMMPQTITYQAYVSLTTDGYAAPYHGTTSGAKSVRCRIQALRVDIRSATSREVAPSTFKILTAPWSTAGTSDTVTVSVLDKITLPSGFIVAGSCAPTILRAYPVQDESGHHHNEVWL